MPKRAAHSAHKVLRNVIETKRKTVWLRDEAGQRHERIP